MFTISGLLAVILVVIVFVILFKILGILAGWLNLPAPIVQIVYWVLVLIAVIWAFGMFGVSQSIIR